MLQAMVDLHSGDQQLFIGFLDISKAYDNLKLDCVFYILELLNISGYFLNVFRRLAIDNNFIIKYNNGHSEPIA